VEPDVTIGPGSRIWHRAQIRQGARIGAETTVGRDAFVDTDVVVGDRVKIQNGALLYHGLTVEDGVFIGPGAILTNDRFPRAITPSGALATADDWTVSPITLRFGCSVGAGAVVVAGVEVGRFALVGAGAIVTRDVPPHALVTGNPARRLGWVCGCGQRLAQGRPGGDQAELRCPACARVYTHVVGSETIEEAETASVSHG
jgi:acetyltransferase-like isoleucine patch superfamily enzyme